jgi:LPS export ABC transporter protein LptC
LHTEGPVTIDRVRQASARAQRANLAQLAILVAGGLSILALVFYFFAPRGGQEPVAEKVKPEFPNQVSATRAEISGVDKDHLPFTIKAVKSTQDKQRADIVHLETVDSTFARPAGKLYAVTSSRARYNDKTKQLELQGEVMISDQAHMVATMDSAEVDTAARSFKSRSPVFVKLENGTVTADQLISNNDGDRLLFRGRVKARYTK